MYHKKLFLNSQNKVKPRQKPSHFFFFFDSIDQLTSLIIDLKQIRNTKMHINVQAIGLLYVKNKEMNI
jgi:hypothetical protein